MQESNGEIHMKKIIQNGVSVKANGHLTLAGADTVALADKYGTPLYLMNESRIRENMRLYKNALARCFGDGSYPLYASKALSMKEIYRIAADEKIGTDIVSAGELYTAMSVGFPPEKMFFHGNNKTDEDIAYAIDCGIGFFVVDNREELDSVNSFAAQKGIRQKILLRLTPGIDPHTFEAVNTGRVDCKFGTSIETGQAAELVGYAHGLSNVTVSGYHCHIGSQSFDSRAFIDAAEIMLEFIADMKTRFGIDTEYLNLGGGYGVRYTDSDPIMDIETEISAVADSVKAFCKRLDICVPNILMEPGRSIVADAGITLYTVGSVKQIKGYKYYISVDGGMTDNPRFALYGAKYIVINATHADSEPDMIADIVGRCCESGDIIQKNVSIKRPVRGEKIAVLVTGAYNYSMSGNYNRLPRPAVVMIRPDGSDSVVVRRESFEDLIKNDI